MTLVNLVWVPRGLQMQF